MLNVKYLSSLTVAKHPRHCEEEQFLSVFSKRFTLPSVLDKEKPMPGEKKYLRVKCTWNISMPHEMTGARLQKILIFLTLFFFHYQVAFNANLIYEIFSISIGLKISSAFILSKTSH